jgi:glutamine amidotransferase
VCRFLAYLGPPATLEAVVLSGSRSLLRQSWEPKAQRVGSVNADGFGVGWYDRAVRPEPARYRRARPIWADRSFTSMAGLIRSEAVLAAIRDASEPLPIEESGAAPFTSGPWLFAHNGCVDGFRTGGAAALRRLASDRRLTEVEGATDSELLFALVLDRLDAGAGPGEALADVVATARRVGGGRFNFVLTNGERVAATCCGDSLSLRGAPGLVVVASEPCDDEDGWEAVPEGAVVEGDRHGVTVKEGAW